MIIYGVRYLFCRLIKLSKVDLLWQQKNLQQFHAIADTESIPLRVNIGKKYYGFEIRKLDAAHLAPRVAQIMVENMVAIVNIFPETPKTAA